MLGYAVDSSSADVCVKSVFAHLQSAKDESSRLLWLACFNPHSYAVSRADSCFSEALRDADWLIPDGAGVLLASRILGGQIRERVTGPDVFYKLSVRMNQAGGHKVFFLGSTEDTLATIAINMQHDFPNVVVAGTYSPPFKAEYSETELGEMISAVNAAQADVLWVGMTAPKQEKWIHQNRHLLNVKFAAAIGAAFDFYAGNVKRAHPTFQKFGLEWFPRLLQQPRRLWRRTFISAPIFLWNVFKERCRIWGVFS